MSTLSNDFDTLLNTSFDEIEGLPPMGVPPSGVYQLRATCEVVEKQGKSPYIRTDFVVDDVVSVTNENEASEVEPGMKFSLISSLFKKDGTKNDFGIAVLRDFLAPFGEVFGTKSMAATIEQMRDAQFEARLTRKINKNDSSRFDFYLNNIKVS